MEQLPQIIEPETVTVRSAYDSLSRNKQAFVDHMVLTGDPLAAYQAVYPGVHRDTARYRGSYWSRDPLVSAAIFERMQGAGERSRVTLENTIAEIGKLAFSNIRKFLRVDKDGQIWFEFKEGEAGQLTEDDWAAVAEVTVEEYKSGRDNGSRDIIKTKIKLHPKLNALDMLMKRWGAYAAQAMTINHTGTVRHDIKPAQITADTPPEKMAEYYAQRLNETED